MQVFAREGWVSPSLFPVPSRTLQNASLCYAKSENNVQGEAVSHVRRDVFETGTHAQIHPYPSPASRTGIEGCLTC